MLIVHFFDVRFQGAEVLNDISDAKKLLPLKHFKKNLKLTFLRTAKIVIFDTIIF